MTGESPRRPQGRRCGLDYIPNKRLFAAVMFALKMIREGVPPGVANTRAASYYDFPVSAVAHYTGQAGGRARARKRRS
jgi:hypothetical protein